MRNEIKAVVTRLREIEAKVEKYLETAELRNDEEASERLDAELEAIAAAIEALENID